MKRGIKIAKTIIAIFAILAVAFGLSVVMDNQALSTLLSFGVGVVGGQYMALVWLD